MEEFRCKFCHRLLAKVESAQKVEIKCPKCKTLNLYAENEIIVVQVDEDYLRRKFNRNRDNETELDTTSSD
ncbi:MAG TPA: Com family DNA-binding transcriptional regulator [Candidatus Omnitrophota bacterium]|nr:Com family DNA-binding transcriptional regulator [Candidatus Omnitrophota bacterium]